jgi:hypothetical protein
MAFGLSHSTGNTNIANEHFRIGLQSRAPILLIYLLLGATTLLLRIENPSVGAVADIRLGPVWPWP